MRGRSLARVAVMAQAVLLAGALIVPGAVAAATLGFTLNAPTLSSVAYSDLVTLRGSYTCVNDGVANCPTSIQSSTATFSLRPAGGSTFSNVGTVNSNFSFTANAGGCPTTCTANFQLSYKAGRAGSATVAPGVYDIGLTTTLFGGQQIIANGLTITAEGTTTTWTGLASGMGGTTFPLSASVVDLDRGLSAGTGIYSPDANLFGAGLVTFEIYDPTNTTLLAGPVSATLLGSGLTTGSPSITLPSVGGALKLRTTFVGNSFYGTSSDLDTINVTPSNTEPVLTVPAGPIVKEATSPAGATVFYTVSAADAEDEPDPSPSCAPASGSTFPIGDTTVECTVTDSGDLADTDSFVVRVVDSLNPGISIGAAEPDNGEGWYNAASNDADAGVTIEITTGDAVGVMTLTCTDNGVDVGALDPAGDSFVIGDGLHAIACAAADAAGNGGSDTDTFKVDQTAPTISAALSSDPDATTGWWNAATGAPSVTFTCDDDGSGLASCSSPSGFGDGGDQSRTGTATDIAGNTATASVTGVDVDLAAPTISASVSPDADATTGWWNVATGAPTVSFDCADATSGLAAAGCPSGHLFGEGFDQSWNGTVFDAAGNAASTGVTGIDVDLTSPSIGASVPVGAASTGWWNASTGAPTVTYTCSDSESGLVSCSEPFTFVEGADQGNTGMAVDAAGNSSRASVGNIDVDLTAPTGLAFVGGGLSSGGSYLFGSVPAGPTGCTATDALSGLGSCQVSGYSTLVGAQAVAGKATDAAGNQATITRSYTVLPWALRGFANPISAGSNSLKAGNTANLKFEVFAGATELSSLDAVTGLVQAQVACGSAALFVGTPTAVASSKNNALKYEGGQYTARWDAPSQPGTCWIVSVVTADGSSLSATFQLK